MSIFYIQAKPLVLKQQMRQKVYIKVTATQRVNLSYSDSKINRSKYQILIASTKVCTPITEWSFTINDPVIGLMPRDNSNILGYITYTVFKNS